MCEFTLIQFFFNFRPISLRFSCFPAENKIGMSRKNKFDNS